MDILIADELGQIALEICGLFFNVGRWLRIACVEDDLIRQRMIALDHLSVGVIHIQGVIMEGVAWCKLIGVGADVLGIDLDTLVLIMREGDGHESV